MPDAERVLDDQYDAVEEALDEVADGGGGGQFLIEALKTLGTMRVEVLYREVRETLEDGDALADEAATRHHGLDEHVLAAAQGEEEALEHLRGELAEMRSEDRDALGELDEAGTDMAHLGQQMETFAAD
jgi:hypothetical protein